MPFAKALLTGRQQPGPVEGTAGPQVAFHPTSIPGNESEDLKDADRLFHDELVSVGRQLSTLVFLAGQIFEELFAEYRLIGDRTDRLSSRINNLSAKVGQLDAKATEIPEASVSSAASHARHFETDYSYHGLAIFDPGNRPLSVQALYGAASPTPVGHLRECDSYRTDDLRGAQIFSRTPIALNKWTDDLFSIGKARQKYSFPPKSRTIRPLQLGLEAKSLPNILQNGTEESLDETGNDIRASESSQDLFTNIERALTPSVPYELHLPLVLMVNVDVSGSSFSQLCKLHAPSLNYEVPGDSLPTASLRRHETRSKRPKTITGVSDLIFHEIDINPPALKHSRSAKFRNSPRNPLNKTTSQTLEIYAPKERRTPKDLKRRTKCFDEDDSKSCGSWRHSLKSVFRLSRSKSRDLWNVNSASEEATRRKSDNNDPLFTLKRSMSLPRSLKSSTKQSTVSFGSFRSSSVEGRLNFRVIQPEKSAIVTNSCASKSPKPVAGERLGRSLTKSLSQVRLGWSSRNRKNFDVPGRPQSMEIRMPSLDEDGRPLLSFYNSSTTNVLSSTTTVTSSGISDPAWAKSLSIIKLRQNENKDQKDDCQSSSGRWSGSSGLTEKQVILESDNKQLTSLGSTTLIGQCPSEMSVNIKDSAMCLHYSPTDSSFLPLDKKSATEVTATPGQKIEKFQTAAEAGKGEEGAEQDNKNNFVKSRLSRRSFISSNSLTRALSVGRKKTTQPNGSGDAKANEINSGHSQCNDDTDDEDCFPKKPVSDESGFRRSMKSDLSKPKTNSRSSFMLKLKKLGKSSKAETPSSSSSTPAERPVAMMTMGDFISQASSETGRSLTPSLPPGESNELKKLGELADRLAAAKAKANCVGALSSSSLSSSSSSGSCITWNRDLPSAGKTPQSLVLGEVNRILQRSAFSVRPSSPIDTYNCSPTEKSNGYFCFQPVNHLHITDGQMSELGSTPGDPPVSPTKMEHRANAKGQKTTELESILETSHEFEATPPYLIRSKKATAAAENGKQVSITEPDSHSDESSINDYDTIRRRTTSAFMETNHPEDNRQTAEDADVAPGMNIAVTSTTTSDQRGSRSPSTAETTENLLSTEFDGNLVPATARLIISSPLASRACFIENPFKRSLCQPLSAKEFADLCTGDLELCESPSPNSSHLVYPETTETSLDVFKHSAGFPVTIRERVDPSNYGRSWYDGVTCDHHSPTVVKGNPSSATVSSYPSFAIKSHLPNPNCKSTKGHVTGSVEFQSQLAFQKPEDAFQKPCHSFSSASPSKYNTSQDNAVSQSIITGGQKRLVTFVANPQVGLGKKCARVVFPSSNLGIPPSSSNHPTSKPNRVTLQGDQKPRTTVNLLHLKTFRGADDTYLHMPSYGGQAALKSGVAWPDLIVPNNAQGVRSNTLPKSQTAFSEKSIPSTTSHQLNLKYTSSVKY